MNKSTTPAANKLYGTIIINVLRPPLLQKEGKDLPSFLHQTPSNFMQIHKMV